MNIIFWTLNRLKRVHLLLIELKHPIFGFERSNFEHCSIHHYSWVPSSSLKFPRVGNKDYYCCSYPTSKQYKVWWSKANWISKIVYPIRMHNALRGMMKSFHRTAVNKVNLILQTQKCTHNCSVIISFQLVLVGNMLWNDHIVIMDSYSHLQRPNVDYIFSTFVTVIFWYDQFFFTIDSFWKNHRLPSCVHYFDFYKIAKVGTTVKKASPITTIWYAEPIPIPVRKVQLNYLDQVSVKNTTYLGIQQKRYSSSIWNEKVSTVRYCFELFNTIIFFDISRTYETVIFVRCMYKSRKASNWKVGNTVTLEHVELIMSNSILYFPDTSDTYTAVMLKWIYYEKAS